MNQRGMVMFCAIVEETFQSSEINDGLSVWYKSWPHASLTLKFVHSPRGKFTLSRQLTRQESAISHPASGRNSLFVTIQTQISTARMVTLDNNSHIVHSVCSKGCDSALKKRHVPFLPFPSRTLLQRSRSSESNHIQVNKSITLHCTLLYFTLLYFTVLYFTLLYFTFLYFTLLYFTLLYFTLLHFTSLHFTSLHFTSLHFTLQF